MRKRKKIHYNSKLCYSMHGWRYNRSVCLSQLQTEFAIKTQELTIIREPFCKLLSGQGFAIIKTYCSQWSSSFFVFNFGKLSFWSLHFYSLVTLIRQFLKHALLVPKFCKLDIKGPSSNKTVELNKMPMNFLFG